VRSDFAQLHAFETDQGISLRVFNFEN